jgi:hypothetical protein
MKKILIIELNAHKNLAISKNIRTFAAQSGEACPRKVMRCQFLCMIL